MNSNDLLEINALWEPIRPYLRKQIEELYGRTDGAILEIGPFSGLIFAFAQCRTGDSFTVAAFPEDVLTHLHQEARSLGLSDSVNIISSEASLRNIPEGTADLVIFRGALFFPSLFHTDFEALYRVLKPAGLAFIGGGFGVYTPPELIQQIGQRSRELNLAIGKVSIEPREVEDALVRVGIELKAKVVTDGGLWVVMRK